MNGKSRIQITPWVLVALFLAASLSMQDRAMGQNAEALKKQLILPIDVEKPEPPLSDKAVFSKIKEGGVRLEIILYPDGSILGFEKRTLGDVMKKTAHARKYKGTDDLRRLFHWAASLTERKTLTEKEGALALADVDLVIFAAPDTPLSHLQKLMMLACEDGICIYRYHMAVQDRKTKEKGFITFFTPADYIEKGDAEEKEFLAHIHSVTLYSTPTDIFYDIGMPGGEDSGNEVQSLDKLKEMVDKLKKKDPKAVFQVCLGGLPYAVPADQVPATIKDYADFLTTMASKGANLQCTKTVVEEVYELIEDD